uniref:Tumor protein D52 family protein n=1 Tax=Wuchereria bancrofti TaxID=6293 RepID=A0A1I8ENB3_WUCBA
MTRKTLSKVGADDEHFINGTFELSEVEKELIREELKKTEEEVNTLRQVLVARQKHASDLKRKLGISPFSEFTADISHSLRHVKESQAYQRTSEVVTGTADTVKNKWNGMRNSSLFKSFESKLGTAYTNAKMAASTSIDQISGMAKSSSGASSQTDPTSPSNDKVQL